MRIGILGRGNIKDLSRYVLDRFTKAEQKKLPDILSAASDACACWAEKGVDAAMNAYNRK
jgi:peptidyl-tRNA hydrolase